MFGSLYVAVGRAGDAAQGEIVDRMLRLAFAMHEAIQQSNRDNMQEALSYCMAIHYDAHGPAIIGGRKGGRQRQYPMSSLFGTTVHGAKCLCLATHRVGGIVLSKNVRSRLSVDVTSELKDRGLVLETVPMSAAVALGSMPASLIEGVLGTEFYTVVAENTSQFGTAAFQQASAQHALSVEEMAGAAMGAQAPGLGKPPLDARRTQQELQEELRKAKQDIKTYVSHLSSAQQNSLMMEQQLSGSQSEVKSLRAQLEEKDSKTRPNHTPLSETLGSLSNLPRHVSTYQYTSGSLPAMDAGANEGVTNTRGSNGNAGTPQNHAASSLLFLQWQNARLQAEVRYLQDALALSKGQVLMHVNRSQAMERKQYMLQERVDHLELDLVLHSAHGGGMKLHQGLPGTAPFNAPMHGTAGLACMSATSCAGGTGSMPAKTNSWAAGMTGIAPGAMGTGGLMGNNLPPNSGMNVPLSNNLPNLPSLQEVMGASMPGGMNSFGNPVAATFGSVLPMDPQAAAGSVPSV